MSDRNHSRPRRTSRGVALEVALEHRDGRELEELLSFWDGRPGGPESDERVVSELRRRMSSEKTVRRRVKFLSKKLVDLLKFFLRGDGYRADLAHVTGSQSFSYLSPFELKAAMRPSSSMSSNSRMRLMLPWIVVLLVSIPPSQR